MQGSLQGVRNLRELFTSKYQPIAEHLIEGGPTENNFFNINKQTSMNWKQKQTQQLQRNKGVKSREGSMERSYLMPQVPKPPTYGKDRSSPDPKQLQQLKRFSITNQGFHKQQQQLSDFIQKSLLVQSDLELQKPLQKTSRQYRIAVPQSNQSSILMMDQQIQSSRRTSQDPQQHDYKEEQQRGNKTGRQYIDLANLTEDKINVIRNSTAHSSRVSQTLKMQEINRNNFTFQFVIGKGGFGKVWKVESRKTKNLYAMKEMSKAKILSKKSVSSVMNERVLLQTTKHPFLVNMIQSFQDRDNLYLVMDLLTGGDLRFHVGRLHRFKEHQTKFFIACMFLALEHLHSNNIIHRDIKPENLVLDHKGYLRVTDLGVARLLRLDNSADTSGTPGYMAPEVMCRQNHGIAVDYYAVGVIGYEFMLGKRPYVGRSRREIRDQILAKQASIKRTDIPEGWSMEAADFINRLLQRKPQSRLGFNGPSEVKSHPWLKHFPWDQLLSKQLEAPYMPKTIDDNYDYQQQISSDNDSQDELIQQNTQLLRRKSVQNLFQGYGVESSQATTKSTANTSINQNTIANTNPDKLKQ